MNKPASFESIISVENLQRSWRIISAKNPAGGIDDISVKNFTHNINGRIERLHASLKKGLWMPTPYLNLEVPKKDGETRTISLSIIEDKLVQTAIKAAIEPILERSFAGSSYAYRPGRGHLRCVRRTIDEMRKKDNVCFFHADVNKLFDSIDRNVLMNRLASPIYDEKVRHLIELCMSMGGVSQNLSWKDSPLGIPQGATLSPLLANFYLTPFDQSILSQHPSYVRYSDDFIIWASEQDEAVEASVKAADFLLSRLGLTLNSNLEIKNVEEGVEFLGLLISPDGTSLTDKKIAELTDMISGLKISERSISQTYLNNIEGIRRYYLEALPESYTELFTRILDESVERWKETNLCINEKNIDDIRHRLLGKKNTTNHSGPSSPHKEVYEKGTVEKTIKRRKMEYKRLEAENSELVISAPGYYLGAGEYGLILRKNGQPMKIRSAAVKHITISSPGVTFSSNMVDYCSRQGIGLTFMGRPNALSASLLSQRYLGTSLWRAQNDMNLKLRHELAKRLILSKLRNQENLCKYFNKYEKKKEGENDFLMCMSKMETIRQRVKDLQNSDGGTGDGHSFNDTLMAYEAAFAELYWEQIRILLSDSGVEFYSRVKQGAKDLVNSMLNYGYALLYPRIWQVLLKRQLNPQIGFVHYAEGNANLVFDFIEMFRSQAVDRTVISMIRRKEHCKVNADGLLDDDTKKKLTSHIMERLNRYESYRGESRTLNTIIDLQASDLAESIESGKLFRAYSAKW